MKKLYLLVLILAASLMLHAQTKTNIEPPRLKVGVVLGGGGAKGAAHIGVLKYMEEMGIPVDYVAGTSMGSILGGLYALGYSPDQLTQLIGGMDWSAYIGNKIDRSTMSNEMRLRQSTMLLNVPFSLQSLFDRNSKVSFISQLPSAYVNNSSLINLFNDLCVGYQEEMDFNKLPIPFACVATDMISGKEVVFRRGSVPTAMRASMAIPGVFSPVEVDGMVLVDGGLVNNFPADVLKEMGADIIIGIEITSNKDVTADDLKSLPQVFARLVTNSTSAKREENRALCDLYIVPDVSGYGMLSFNPQAIDSLVGRGYKKAAEFHEQFMRVKQAVDHSAGHSVVKTLHAPKAMNIAVDSVLIRSITINGTSDSQNNWLIRKGRLKVGEKYTQNSIEKTMQIFRGTGCFDEITYQVKESDSLHQNRLLEGVYDLRVNMKPAKPHVFGLGLRYDTEEGAALLLNVSLNEKKFGGSKFNASIKLSYSPRINLTYTYAAPALANFSVAYDYRDDHFKWMLDSYKGVNIHYYQHKVSGYISQFHLLNLSTAVGVSYSNNSFDLASTEESLFDSIIFQQNRLFTPFVTLKYDNLDDSYFAKRGISADVKAQYHFDTQDREGRYFDLGYAFQAYITPNNGKWTIIPQFYGRHRSISLLFNLWNTFGGEIAGRHFEGQLPFIGLASVADADENLDILRCDVRYNFYGKHYLTAMYNFMFQWSSWETNPLTTLSNGLHGAGIKYAYNSFLGPVSFTAHWAGGSGVSHFGAYFSFGYTF